MTTTIPFSGCLFDLDGTLIDSYPAVIRSWTKLADKHNLDIDHVFRVIHGRPAGDSIREFLKDKDPEIIEQEIKWLEEQESVDTDGVEPLKGTIEFLNLLNQHHIPWAIVTSGTHPVASARINAAHLPEPPQLVTADIIRKGKPDPEPFLLGADKIGIDVRQCIVFEDAPAGIQSGIASGANVVGVLSHHDLKQQFGITCVNDLSQLSVTSDGKQHRLVLDN